MLREVGKKTEMQGFCLLDTWMNNVGNKWRKKNMRYTFVVSNIFWDKYKTFVTCQPWSQNSHARNYTYSWLTPLKELLYILDRESSAMFSAKNLSKQN